MDGSSQVCWKLVVADCMQLALRRVLTLQDDTHEDLYDEDLDYSSLIIKRKGLAGGSGPPASQWHGLSRSLIVSREASRQPGAAAAPAQHHAALAKWKDTLKAGATAQDALDHASVKVQVRLNARINQGSEHCTLAFSRLNVCASIVVQAAVQFLTWEADTALKTIDAVGAVPDEQVCSALTTEYALPL
jgi:hypothetical protein